MHSIYILLFQCTSNESMQHPMGSLFTYPELIRKAITKTMFSLTEKQLFLLYAKLILPFQCTSNESMQRPMGSLFTYPELQLERLFQRLRFYLLRNS